MKVLKSNDSVVLENIVSQINLLCGWPNVETKTMTATIIQWSNKAKCFWCSVEDVRILAVINNVQLNGLIIEDLDIGYFQDGVL